FELRVRPAYDFCQELLSYGEEVEVLSPQYVRDYITDRIRKSLSRYKA
ncbi:MAG: WYL domain-containing protein, partial [Prevotella sp.]|nr:WYL domain-containing protein [Prevotella sp.]MBQ2060366.1 WYL domain-containing protein [Prevotella sp.]